MRCQRRGVHAGAPCLFCSDVMRLPPHLPVDADGVRLQVREGLTAESRLVNAWALDTRNAAGRLRQQAHDETESALTGIAVGVLGVTGSVGGAVGMALLLGPPGARVFFTLLWAALIVPHSLRLPFVALKRPGCAVQAGSLVHSGRRRPLEAQVSLARRATSMRMRWSPGKPACPRRQPRIMDRYALRQHLTSTTPKSSYSSEQNSSLFMRDARLYSLLGSWCH